MLAHKVCKWHQTGAGTSQYMQGQDCHSEGHGQDGGMGQQENDDIQQGQMQSQGRGSHVKILNLNEGQHF